jgi:hypothetical protein
LFSYKNGLDLRIELPKGTRYRAGSDVPLRIFFDNSGSGSVKLGFASDPIEGQTSLILDIRDSSGKPAKLGLQYHMSPFGRATRDFFVTLAPDHFYGWTENLIPYTHAFLNTPGDYDVTAVYDYAPPNGELKNSISIFSGRLKSTTLKITVVPPEEKP